MTTTVRDMLSTYPGGPGDVDAEALARCIEECVACAQACTACADACLAETTVAHLTTCVRTDADVTRAVLRACSTVCAACADECENHAGMHGHCRVCAEACRRCGKACDELIASLG